MLPQSNLLLAFLSVQILLMGAVVGAVAGILAAALFRNSWSGVGWDAGLGAMGLLGTIIFFVVMPWPRNTVNIVLDGKVVGTSTMNSYQHYSPAGLTIAVLLPIVHEASRRWRRVTSN